MYLDQDTLDYRAHSHPQEKFRGEKFGPDDLEHVDRASDAGHSLVLVVKLASKLYRLRWENEGFFRTYKRTLRKVKLMSPRVRLAHREAEGSMIATLRCCAKARWQSVSSHGPSVTVPAHRF